MDGGHGVIVETRIEPCGKASYSKLVVPHDWNPKPLNICECGREITRWTSHLGHVCACGKSCNRECVR
jgi:hypothetical protein